MSRKKQDSFVQQLKRACEWSAKTTFDKTNKAEVEERISQIREVYQNASEEQDNMEDITGAAEMDGQYVIRGQMEEYFFATISKLRVLLNLFNAANTSAQSDQSSSSSSATSSNNHRHEWAIPEVPIPTFDGDYKNWIPFIELFNSLVNSRTSLSNSQKMHLLKSHLRGEAAQLLQTLQVTNENYAEARKILENRYNNKRFIIDSYLKAFISHPKVQDETALGIRKLYDIVIETVRSLTVLGVPVNHWDLIIIFIVLEKLDHDSRRQWELSMTRNALPTLQQLTTFLDNRWQSLEMVPQKRLQQPPRKTNIRSMVTESNTTQRIYGDQSCPICNGTHNAFKCSSFSTMSIEARIKLLTDTQRCFNCLQMGHKLSACPSTNRCRMCGSKHHTMIHERYSNASRNAMTTMTTEANNDYSTTELTTIDPTSPNSSTVYSHVAIDVDESTVLLATAVVVVRGANNSSHRVRALFDSGSESSFITESTVQRLGLQSQQTSMSISGIGHTNAGKSFSKVILFISSRHDPKFAITTTALTLPKITGKLPAHQLNHEEWQHLNFIPLADPQYYSPKSVDLLLGADILGLCLRDGRLKSANGSPFALNTAFGYILFGKILSSLSPQPRGAMNINVALSESQERSLDIILKSFWETEEISSSRALTSTELRCEEHFMQTVYRDNEGRFVVSLPFVKSAPPLGDSKVSARIRLNYLERKFRSSIEFKSLYVDFMRDYLYQNHMELVTTSAKNQQPVYYLPHHGIIKNSSTTTKLRVVFDASNRTTNGISLNDNLLIGQKIQQDITTVITRWRIYRFVLMADIKQMYRQIRINSKDCDYQRILWREDESEPIKEYRLLTVTYGTSSAPFLAVRSLQQLALESRKKFPLATNAILNGTYVDDIMSGADDEHTLITLKNQLNLMLKSAKFELRKWSSNSQNLLDSIPNEHHLQPHVREINFCERIQALGITWCPSSDQFSIRVSLTTADNEPTKRKILSDAAKLYDPLGWLAPSIITVKILFQELWQLGVGWDDCLPTQIVTNWLKYRTQLNTLNEIKIPRWFGGFVTKPVAILGFCDASTVAYAAVVYAKIVQPNGTTRVTIMSSKTRVAPINTVSISRLELCAAALLARLIESVKLSLNQGDTRIFAWSDSQVALGWLQGNPTRWQTYVANRVIQTINVIPPSSWRYVSTDDNPADCASRGLPPQQLKSHQIWWSGPGWLCLPPEEWPKHKFNEIDLDKLPETRQLKTHSLVSQKVDNDLDYLLNKYSSIGKLQRITAWCKRFADNAHLPQERRQSGTLKPTELRWALFQWIKVTQLASFADEIYCCLSNNAVLDGSRLRSLHPFVDAQGVLRVGGRLANSHLDFEAKYPIVLPKYSPLTNLIITQIHNQTLHGGSSIMLAHLHRTYWVLGAKQLVRKFVHNCVVCARYSGKCFNQLMGQLPAARVTPSRPFLNSGVDYAGPIMLKTSRTRNAAATKSYIAVFICLATKAMHLELVSDLTTDAFLAAFNRFTSRRGRCANMFSDCGTNFVGAERELVRLLAGNMADKNSVLARHLATDGVNWSFIPPAAPHFGGLWEAGVKSMKHHLRRILGNSRLTFEELTTVLAQIEACLNSRPLCPLSDDINDCNALTPGHFLIGEPLTATPYPNLVDVNMHRLNRWQLVQQLFQHFWSRWSNEYLRRLQVRPKWTGERPNISVGQLVLVMNETTSPSKWPLARVVAARPGRDGLVRVVSLKTGDNIIDRAIVKLRCLPVVESCSPNVLQGEE